MSYFIINLFRYTIFILVSLLLFSNCKENKKSTLQSTNYLHNLQLEDLPIEKQDSIVAQLFQNSLNLKNNKESRIYLQELSDLLEEYGEEEQYLKTLHRLKSFFKTEKDTLTLAKVYSELGVYYEASVQYDSSFSYFDRAEKQYQLLGNKLKIGEMAISKASILYDFGIYTEAEAEAIRALQHFQDEETIGWDYECFHLLGLILCELKEFDTSLNYFNKTTKTLEAIEQQAFFSPEDITEAYAALYNNIAGVYELKKQYKEALSEYEKAFNLNKVEQVNPLLYAALLNNRAYMKMKLDRENEVLEDLFKAMNIRDSLSQHHELNMSYLNLAEYYAITKDTATALDYTHKAYLNAIEIKNLLDEKEALEYFIRLDKDQQLKYNQEYVDVSDKIRKTERQTQHKFARIAYETEQIESQVELLEIRNRNTIGLAILSTLLLLGSLFLSRLLYRNKKLQLQNTQQQADEKIYHLMLHQQELSEQAKNSERERIASELHDGVINRIFTTRFNLMQLESPMQEYKDLLIDELQKAEHDIRDVSHRLTQEIEFKDTSFKKLIEDLISQQNNSFNTLFSLSVDQAIDWANYNPHEKIQLYRILQEALQNVNKYSIASQCNIWFLKNKDDLLLKIEDNGIGFDENSKAKGIGISNMKKRVKELQGELTITSKVNMGTQIEVHIKDARNDNIL